MNSITVAGQLGKDAELRHMPNGDPVTSFSVADSQGRDKPTIWWNAQIFGKRSESLRPYLVKGQAVTISGTVAEREWQDKDGQKRKSMDVRVHDIALQGGRKDSQDGHQQPTPRNDAQRQGNASQPATAARAAGGFADMDDDVPWRDPMACRAFCLVV